MEGEIRFFIVEIGDFVDLRKNKRVRTSALREIHAHFQLIHDEWFKNMGKSHVKIKIQKFFINLNSVFQGFLLGYLNNEKTLSKI